MQLQKMTDQIALAQSDGSSPLITDVASALDLIASTWEEGSSGRLILRKADILESFFDLKTGIAGEIIQKFVNYNLRVAIVGDFSGYTSKALRDFIYESNQGRVLYFVGSMEEAIAVLSS